MVVIPGCAQHRGSTQAGGACTRRGDLGGGFGPFLACPGGWAMTLTSQAPGEAADAAASGRPCRFCGAPLRHTFVDLGSSPLCESFLTAAELNRMEPFYP